MTTATPWMPRSRCIWPGIRGGATRCDSCTSLKAWATLQHSQRVSQEKREATAAAAVRDAREAQEAYLSGVLADGDTDAVAVRLHHLLKAYPALRECWLSASPLSALVNANADGASHQRTILDRLKVWLICSEASWKLCTQNDFSHCFVRQGCALL